MAWRKRYLRLTKLILPYSPVTLLTKLRNLPEVEAGGLSVHELLSGGSWNQNVTIDNGRRFTTDGLVHCNAITSGFFATLGVPIVAGRDFDSREANQVAPVNRAHVTSSVMIRSSCPMLYVPAGR